MIVMKHSNINSGEPKMATNSNLDGTPFVANETDEQRAARTGLSSVRITDDESKQVQKTEHRVSLDSILAKIKSVDYLYPASIMHMTIAVVLLENGFAVIGKSAPADAENFHWALGQKFAKEDAIRQIWPLEAYLLREKLNEAGEYGKVG